MTTTTPVKELSFMEYLEQYYGFEGNEDEVYEEIYYRNRFLINEYLEEDWCLSLDAAQTEVIKDFQKEYIKDAKIFNFIRTDKRFWWE